MTTRQNIEDAVKESLIDVNAEVEARITGFVQKALNEMQTGPPGRGPYHFEAQEAETSPTATAEDTRNLMTLPADWLESRDDPFYIDGTGKTVDIAWMPSDRSRVVMYDEYDPLDKGAPRHLDETATHITVWPFPDALNPSGSVYSDGNYRVVVPYWKEIEAPNAADTNWFFDNAGLNSYIEWRATALALGFNRDTENRLLYETDANAEYLRLRREDKKKVLRRGGTLEVRRDVNARPGQWRS